MVKPRVLFLGTPDFAVPTLRALLDFPEVVVAGVVTQPDRRAGRGRKRAAPPVKKVALDHRLPLLQPAKLRGNPEAERFLSETAPDLLAVAAFGQMLPRLFFEGPPHGALNVHASLLPRYRGAAPVVYALLNGERETGVTIMRIDQGLDTGDMVAQAAMPVPPDMTAGELEARLARLGARLLIDTIPPYLAGAVQPQPQDDGQATYAPSFRKEDARINWTRPAREVHNRVRAFNPRPGAFCSFRGEYLKIWSTTLPAGSVAAGAPGPGVVLGWEGERLLIGCGAATSLALAEVQPANRKRMTAREFGNGFGLSPGEEFS